MTLVDFRSVLSNSNLQTNPRTIFTHVVVFYHFSNFEFQVEQHHFGAILVSLCLKKDNASLFSVFLCLKKEVGKKKIRSNLKNANLMEIEGEMRTFDCDCGIDHNFEKIWAAIQLRS